MTNYEIVKQALAHLEYGTDEDSVATFLERFIIYINDAVRTIAQHIKLENVDDILLYRSEHFDTSMLSKKNVTKIVEVFSGRHQLPFFKGDRFGDFVVDHCQLKRFAQAYAPTLLGDANNDGSVNAQDSSELGHFVYGSKVPTHQQFMNADVDGDQKLTESDETLLDQYLDHNIDHFPAESMGDLTRYAVNVRYRYLPENVVDPTAEPDIPELFHPIIYLFVVHAFHNTRSTSSDYDRTKWIREFDQQMRALTRQYGALDEYTFKNRPWETREM